MCPRKGQLCVPGKAPRKGPGKARKGPMIPACLWFIARDKKNSKFRYRRGRVLFIDARNMGVMIDRRHRELTDDDVAKITYAYHAWRAKGGKYKDIAGFCKSAGLEEIKKHGYILTPGRYVGTAEVKEDDEAFEEKMKRLAGELSGQFKKSEELERERLGIT